MSLLSGMKQGRKRTVLWNERVHHAKVQRRGVNDAEVYLRVLG